MTATQTHSNPVAAGPDIAASLPCSMLRMAVGAELLAVPIEHVREILQVSRMTPLPRTPSFVRGVMNLRGSVVPVIDLAARLGGPSTELGRRTCIVVVETSATPTEDDPNARPLVMGLLVDAVFEVFDRSGHEIEPAPALGTAIAPQFLHGMTRAAGSLIGVLALGQVLSARELAQCIAQHQPH
jgi:purine-binding chemotaxis protein CheW